MAISDYISTDGKFYQATVVDSFTAPDGTVYEARAGVAGNGIVKITTNEDGSTNEEALTFQKTTGVRYRDDTKETRTRKNTQQVTTDFNLFKSAAEAAANTTEAIGYTDDDITPGGGGFLKRDRPSTVTLTDASGNTIGSVGTKLGRTSSEVNTAKKLADEIVNINKSAITIVDDEEEIDDDVEDTTDGSDGTTGTDTTGLTAGDYMQTVDPAVAGGAFQAVTPPTTVQQVPAGGVPIVDPDESQTVVQQVAPITYQDVPVGVTPTGPTPEQMTTSVTSPTTAYTSGFAPPQTAVTGTFSQPLQTAGLSAVPQQVTYKTNYAGTQGAVPQTLVTTQPGTGATYPEVYQGYQTVPYGNNLGQVLMITEFNGQPTTYVPPGFSKLTGEAQATQQQTQQQPQYKMVPVYDKDGNVIPFADGIELVNGTNTATQDQSIAAAEGGLMETMSLEGKDRIFRKMGYDGPKTREGHAKFEEANPAAKAKGLAIGGYIQKFNRGGAVQGYQEGGLTTEQLAQMQANAVRQTMQPMQPTTAMIQPTAGEFIPVDAGMTTPIAPFAESATVGTVQQAGMPVLPTVATATADQVTDQVKLQTAGLTAATGTPTKEITAEQQVGTSITGMEAELGNAIKVDAPDPREIKDGEIISGEADATKAATFTEAVQAAEATPSKQATVAGQLEQLMADFEGGETPAWAAGSMRTAMATLSARGLGASSLAGQAVVQAAMEAALPIAQMDAATIAQFEAQNLSNRQQRQMLAAQQRATFMGMEFDQAFQARVANSARIGDIANMNFTAEQQIALENSRAANTMELSNLSNRQAMVMAEAAALSQLDMANLSNRQQAAVQNAANFLQMDMANLSNEQQTSMFKTQQNIQALFTDQAAENAMAQFNASSENQTNQFFANLANQTAQFNATQQNAMDQFNVNSVNALREFNSGLQQQRDLFNAQNGLVIAQSNAAWRQSIATINTATQNESNMDFAKVINGLTAANMDQIWQRERDLMSFAFQLENNNADRATTIAVQELANEAAANSAAASKSGSFANAIGTIVGSIITG